MKTVGIIGGLGPESTVDYYRLIIAAWRARTMDVGYPSIIINSGDLDKALEHFQKALTLHEKIRNPLGQAQQLGNMGNIYAQKGDLDKALEHFQKALGIFERIGAKLDIESAKENIAWVEKLKAEKK